MTRNPLTIPVLLLMAGFFCGQATATTVTTRGEAYLANLTSEEAWLLALKRSCYNVIKQAWWIISPSRRSPF